MHLVPRSLIFAAATFAVLPFALGKPAPAAPIVGADVVFEEVNGLVAVEAEHFFKQELADVRAWHIVHAGNIPKYPGDSDDSAHVKGASGGAYIELLPDTRATHDEKLINGENFIKEPGKMAVISYKVLFKNPGRYHVWCRVFSTGPEDNGVHVGINGTWPESGQRWQTTKKHAWQWDSRQRTEAVHVGVPGQLFLDVPSAGEHVISFAMREDGFEMDKFILASDAGYQPTEAGPAPGVVRGRLPAAFAIPASYTEAESKPAAAATTRAAAAVDGPITVLPSSLKLEGTGFYLDQGKWAAIHPDKNKEASVKFTSPAANGRYRIVLHVVGENDGNASFDLIIGGRDLGTFTAPPSTQTFEEGPAFTHTYPGQSLNQGESIEIRARIASNDGKEWSRARWSKLVFITEQADPGREASRLDLAAAQQASLAKPVPRQPSGKGAVTISGELRAWHKVTLDLAGPFAAENDTAPNPFTDYRLAVTFTHESGSPSYTVPGYFAADGNAGNTSATAGTVWRTHLSPDKPGKWNYRVSFTQGSMVALNGGGTTLAPFDGKTGSVTVKETNKTGRDFRSKGRLTYTGGHYLQHAGTGEYFLKAGADSPETLLAYADFDDTIALKANVPLKTWAPHLKDWKTGDPTWKGGKGKALVGALNYLAGKGVNAFSFLPYNAAGDGDNIWPFIAREAKFHYDCSKLDQWGIIFDHAQQLGLYLHFKLQETENDDNTLGHDKPGLVTASLDGGNLGPERKLYLREIIARFGHALALNWNLGEENTQTTAQQRAMAQYIRDTDPYSHLAVIHTFPNEQDKVYEPLLGVRSTLTGASLQNSWNAVHRLTLKWVRASALAGRPWVVANDEQGSASTGAPPDHGYQGYNNVGRDGKAVDHDMHDVRKATIWGNLMAGGAGVELYFGYQLPENDLVCEDWRSRDRTWDYARIALDFFRNERIPFHLMTNANEIVGNTVHDNSVYCFAQPGALYLVYLPKGGTASLELGATTGTYNVSWYNTRTGGALQQGSVKTVTAGGSVALGTPPADATEDWLVVVRR